MYSPAETMDRPNFINSNEEIIHQETEPFPNNTSSFENENSVGHPYLIGVDRNFFEQKNDPNNVILIGNPGILINGPDINFEGSSTYIQKPILSSGNYLVSYVEPVTSVDWDQNALRQVRIVKPDLSENETSHFYVNSLYPSISQSTVFDNDKNLESETIVEVGAAQTTVEEGIASFELENGFNVKKEEPLCFDTGGETKEDEFNGARIKETHLPLKKKTKMKSVLYLEKSETKFTDCKEEITIECAPQQIAELPDSQNSSKRLKKRIAGQRRCCYSDSDLSDRDDSDTEDTSRPFYEDIYDFLKDLNVKNLIDEKFAALIKTGIEEMKVNVFEELNSPVEVQHSFQLLTFAFLLYFKKRPAYYYLRQVYKKKWPTVSHLKDWKKLVNSKRRRRKKI